MLLTRESIINAFKKGIFPYKDGFKLEKESDEEPDEESTLESEEIDTTDILGLETEKSAAGKRNHQG